MITPAAAPQFAARYRPDGSPEPLRDHLAEVEAAGVRLCALLPSDKRAAAEESVRAAARLHDAGKATLTWQRDRLGWDPAKAARTSGSGARHPHSAAGAQVAALLQSRSRLPLRDRRGAEVVMPILAHHSGLPSFADLPATLASADAQARECLKALGSLIQRPTMPTWEHQGYVRSMWIRMLTGMLVHADRSSAAGWSSPRLTSADKLLERLAESESGMDASGPLSQVRRWARARCLEHGGQCAPGVWRLSLPTGTGKTLSSVTWALSHLRSRSASEPGREPGRVIYAAPLTAIIEQTADALRAALERAEDDEPLVLEHHSAAQELEKAEDRTWAEQATEGWDAPVVVTTTVQLFESLFSSRAGVLRKLPALCGSVVILDEAQGLPLELIEGLSAAIRVLVEEFGATVLLCTASQPALEHLRRERLDIMGDVIPQSELPELPELRRVRTTDRTAEPQGLDELASELTRLPQALCIVDSVERCRELAALLESSPEVAGRVTQIDGRMSPARKRAAIERVRSTLAAGQPCLLIATQVVEAGVDLSFPSVWRQLGPLESMLQAAGRANRHGELGALGGQLTIFRLQGSRSPRGSYQQRTREASHILSQGLDILSPATVETYYRSVYGRLGPCLIPTERGHEPLGQLEELLNFPAVERGFRMVEDRNVPVLDRSFDPQAVDDALAVICMRGPWKDLDARRRQVRSAWRALRQHIGSAPPREAEGLMWVPELEALTDRTWDGTGERPPGLRQLQGALVF